MKNLLVGIDVGTTGLKVALYTLNGQLVARAYREYSLSFPQNGWAEIDPEIWWEQLGDCMKEIRSQNGVDLKAVAGIGITCSNSLVLLNADQQAVLPAIMQLDQRAVRQAEAMKSEYGQEWVFQKTGNRVSSGAFWGPSLQWVRENRPSLYRQAQFFLVPTGFLVLRLTGVYSIDHSRATTTMLYNIHEKNWDAELCHVFGLSPEALPPIYPSHEMVGTIHKEGERATGLPAGTPVIAGAMDTVGALAGMGTGPDTGALIMGSVGRLCIESNELDIRFMNTVNYDASSSLIMTPVNSAGVSYKWAKQLFFSEDQGPGNIYKKMDRMTQAIAPGAEGLIYMPYLAGERSPIWDPHATGSFMGFTMKHGKGHFLRAVLEGVGLALAQNHEILKAELNIDPPFLMAGGGGAGSQVWMQIISDMLGKPLYIPEKLETETMGAAMLTGVGVGLFSDLSQVNKDWVRVSETVMPRMDVNAQYRELLSRFKTISIQNRSLFQQLK
ncbi:xylulokinase [Paenibacillus sp. YK5]